MNHWIKTRKDKVDISKFLSDWPLSKFLSDWPVNKVFQGVIGRGSQILRDNKFKDICRQGEQYK